MRKFAVLILVCIVARSGRSQNVETYGLSSDEVSECMNNSAEPFGDCLTRKAGPERVKAAQPKPVDIARKRLALAALLCVTQAGRERMLSSLKSEITILAKSPLNMGAAESIVSKQRLILVNDARAIDVKTEMTNIRSLPMSCADARIKKLAYCFSVWYSNGSADAVCDEPEVAIFRGIDGVPVFKD